MAFRAILSAFLSLLLLLRGTHSALVGNYQLWDYYSPGTLYDYGPTQSRHAAVRVSGIAPISTDRGLYLYDKTVIEFPTNSYTSYPSSQDYVSVSMWFYPINTSRLFVLNPNNGEAVTSVGISKNNDGTIAISLNDAPASLTTSEVFKSWRLFTVVVTILADTNSSIVSLFSNTSNVELLNMNLVSYDYRSITLTWSIGGASHNLNGFLYEIWWYDTVVPNLNDFISSSCSGCTGGCTLSPYLMCLSSQEDPLKNSNGAVCSCSGKSCTNSGICINQCIYPCISSGSCRSFNNPICPEACPTATCKCIPNTDRCYECNLGYIMNSGSCIPSVPNCKTYTQAYVCSKCDMNFYLKDPSTCSKVANCLTYNLNGSCDVCLDGYYKLDSFNCPSCTIPNCLTCILSTTQKCTKCADNYWIQPNFTCDTTCPVSYFKDSRTLPYKCSLCGDGCLECEFSQVLNKFYCLKCPSSPIMYYIQPYEHTKLCDVTCPVGSYLRVDRCIYCSSNCDACSSETICTACRAGYFLVTLPDESVVCEQCLISQCKVCQSASICKECNTNYHLTTVESTLGCRPCEIPSCKKCGSYTVCETCNQYYYINTISDTSVTCGACPSNCNICTSDIVCTSCPYPYFLTPFSDGSVLCKLCEVTFCTTCSSYRVCSACNYRYYKYYSGSEVLCGACSANCNTCTSDTMCTSCDWPYLLSNIDGAIVCRLCEVDYCSTCLSYKKCGTCNIGYYKIYDGSYELCGACSSNCDYCSDSNTCTSCRIGYSKVTIDSTVVCIACPSNCNYCTDSNTCTQCMSPYLLSNISGAIVCRQCEVPYCSRCSSYRICETCYNRFYKYTSGDEVLCGACSSFCNACTSSTICTGCDYPYLLSNINGEIVCRPCEVANCSNCISYRTCNTCSMRYYKYALGDEVLCGACSAGCRGCIDDKICNTCDLGLFLTPLEDGSKVCLSCELTNCITCSNIYVCSQCAYGYYRDIISDNNIPCAQCLIPSCTVCQTGIKCISCQTKYYLNTISSTEADCQACPNPCSTCTSFNICTGCIFGYWLKVVDAYNHECRECTVPNCDYCLDESNCRICKIYYELTTIEDGSKKCYTCLGMNCVGCAYDYQCKACTNGYFLKPFTENNSEKIKCELCIIPYCLQCLTDSICGRCPVGYYLDEKSLTEIVCTKCPSACPDCNNPTDCLSCIDGYYLQRDVNTNICLPCEVNHCKTCNPGINCEECFPDYILLYKNSQITCTLDCNTSIYLTSYPEECIQRYDTSSIRCTPYAIVTCSTCLESDPKYSYNADSCKVADCPIDCIICIDNNGISECEICKAGYYMSENKTKCFESCPDEYYTYTPTKTCYPCTTNCLKCPNDPDICTSCKQTDIPYFLKSDSTCTSVCPETTFENYSTLTCDNCLSGCKTCYNSSACVECVADKYLVVNELSMQCVSSCSVGFYTKNLPIKECLNCRVTRCIECEPESTALIGLACTKCSTGYVAKFANGISECLIAKCPANCQVCRIKGNDIFCFICNPGYILQPNKMACALNCPVYYYSDGIKCVSCPPNCKVCSNLTVLNCIECDDNYYMLYNKDLSECIPKCEEGYYTRELPIKECVKCDIERCTQCKSNPIDILGIICDKCISGYVARFVNSISECFEVSCPIGCDECTSAGDDVYCNICSTGYKLNSDRKGCSPNCSQNCMRCDSRCLECEESYLLQPFESEYQLECQISCPYGFYPDNLRKICKKCASKCELCTSFNKCIKCVSGYKIHEIEDRHICKIGCPDHFYYDSSTHRCRKCMEGCSICADGISCMICNSGLYLQPPDNKQVCDIICPSGYYPNQQNQSCSECPYLCINCEILEGKMECEGCVDFAYKNGGICKCYDTDNQTSENRCPESCPGDLEINFSESTCYALTYTEKTIKKAFKIESMSSSYSLFLAPLIGGFETAWAMMNAIQILLFIGIINVNIPILLRVSLKAQKSYLLGYDIFQEISENSLKPFSTAYEFKYPSSAYLYNIGKPVFHLGGIIVCHSLILLLSIISKGKIKTLVDKIKKLFQYSVYIRYLIQMYLELLIPAFIQILYVRYIQPQDDTLSQIILYNISILFIVIFIQIFALISPYLFTINLVTNHKNLDKESFIEKWGAIYNEFKTESKYDFLYYQIFFVRRFIVSISLVFLKDFQIIQISICSAVCWIVIYIQVFIYVLIRRPFKQTITNWFCIIIELITSVTYSLNMFFIIDANLDSNTCAWSMITLMKLSYLIYITVTSITLVKAVAKKIKDYRDRRLVTAQTQIIITTKQ